MHITMITDDLLYRSVRSDDAGEIVVEDLNLNAWIKGDSDLVLTRRVVSMDSMSRHGEWEEGVTKAYQKVIVSQKGNYSAMMHFDIEKASGYDISLKGIKNILAEDGC